MPDNVAYLNLGLLVVMGLTTAYVVLLIMRFRSAYRQRKMIQNFREA
jgi:HAMP domain-containing protein